MFSIFSMRRPDILPVGMYMVSRVWLSFLDVSKGDLGVQRGLLRWCLSLHSADHSFGTSNPPESSEVKPTDVFRDANPEALNFPPSLTPTKNSLKQTNKLERQLQPLPLGLSVSTLKSRLEGKKIK
jgi:DNA-3-methyladenine glycosylase II